MNIFCVIDVQYPFVQAEDARIIEEIANAVVAAKERGDTIFLVEDRHGHSTDERITNVLRDYARVYRLSKNQWDGSLQIAMKLSDMGIEATKFTACGAFGEQCVLATLSGLRDRYPAVALALIYKGIVPAPTQSFSLTQWQNVCKRLGISLIEK